MRGLPVKEVKQIYFDDVTEGTEIPSIVKNNINVVRESAIYSAVTGIFAEMHLDHSVSQKWWGTPPNMYGVQLACYMARAVTDWMGPNSVLKKLATITKHPVYHGDSIIVGGKVIRKYINGEQNLVDCELTVVNQKGDPCLVGSATVILPSR